MKKNILLIPNNISRIQLISYYKQALGIDPAINKPYYFFHTLVSRHEDFPSNCSDFFNLDFCKITLNTIKVGRTEKNQYPCLFMERNDALMDLRKDLMVKYGLTDSRERYRPKLILAHTKGQVPYNPDFPFPETITFDRIVLKDIHEAEFDRKLDLRKRFQQSFLRRFFDA